MKLNMIDHNPRYNSSNTTVNNPIRISLIISMPESLAPTFPNPTRTIEVLDDLEVLLHERNDLLITSRVQVGQELTRPHLALTHIVPVSIEPAIGVALTFEDTVFILTDKSAVESRV